MLPQKHRLPLRSKLQDLQRIGRRYHSPLITLLVAPQANKEYPRFAFVVSKRLDKRATRRNRTKRVLREAMKMLLPQFHPGYDVVVYAKKILWQDKLEDITLEIKKALEKAGLIRDDNNKSTI